jgi:hypothetical protein
MRRARDLLVLIAKLGVIDLLAVDHRHTCVGHPAHAEPATETEDVRLSCFAAAALKPISK